MSRIAALVALVLLPSALLAQSDSHIEAAQELLVLTKTREATEQAFEQIYPLFSSMSEQQAIPDEYRETMAEDLQANLEFVKKELNWSVLEPRLVQMYVGVYSEEELRGLNEFYRTPLGQKFIAKTPEIMAASSQMTMELFRELLPKLNAMQKERRQERMQRDTD